MAKKALPVSFPCGRASRGWSDGGELKANMTAKAEIVLDEHKGVDFPQSPHTVLPAIPSFPAVDSSQAQRSGAKISANLLRCFVKLE
jgi:hypothetical protein